MNTLYYIACAGFIALTLFVYGLAFYYFLLYTTGAKQRIKVFVQIAGLLLFWIVIVLIFVVTPIGRYLSDIAYGRWILSGLPLLLVSSLFFSRNFVKLVNLVPPTGIVFLQSFRLVAGLLMWVLFIIDRIPMSLTFEGRNFDVFTGLTAPLVALSGIRNRMVMVLWNMAGIALLFNMISIILSSGADILFQVPIFLLSGFLIPIGFLLHLLSLRRVVPLPVRIS
jgi:hypothetical protein